MSIPDYIPSKLLSQEENDTVRYMLGDRRKALATSVVEVFYNLEGSWEKWFEGVICLIKDFKLRTYFFTAFNLQTNTKDWEQQIYNNFEYKNHNNFFHQFEGDSHVIGFNFADDREGAIFYDCVHRTILMKQLVAPNQRRDVKKKVKPTKTEKTTKKKRLNKLDIGYPTDFRHVVHRGLDEANLLEEAGLPRDILNNPERKKNVEEILRRSMSGTADKKKIARPAPPPPGLVKHLSPPSKARPTSVDNSTGPAPPPPPPASNAPAPPPPPPPSNAPAPPPPPPMNIPSAPSQNSPAPSKTTAPKKLDNVPPITDDRSNLLSDIRSGIKLKPVGQNKPPVNDKIDINNDNDIASALAKAISARGKRIELSSESEGSDESDWDE